MKQGVAREQSVMEVCFGITTTVASKLFVVNLQVRHSTAELTTPIIATQNLLA